MLAKLLNKMFNVVMNKKFLALILTLFIFSLPACAKWKFKKTKKEKPYMVQTYDEWLESALDVELSKRIYTKPELVINKKINIVDPTPYLAKYNLPVGSNEVDLFEIKNAKTLSSIGVASPIFDKLAIVHYYYAPFYNQISSEIFIVPLDTEKPRTERILNAKIIDTDKGTNLAVGAGEFQQDLYSTLTIVDWSTDGRMVLVKEKIGSSNNGIFKTNIWTVYPSKNGNIIKNYPQLQTAIMNYWRKNGGIILSHYRFDINILGFDKNNPDMVVAVAFAYEKNGGKITLGTWGVNVYTGEVSLISTKNSDVEISTNGLILKFKSPSE